MGRLTDEEARMTAAHTLEVVHGLVNNLKVVIDGVQIALRWLSTIVLTGSNRRQGVIGGHTTGVKYVQPAVGLSMFLCLTTSFS